MVSKPPYQKNVLFDRAYEQLGAAVAFWRVDEGGQVFNAGDGELLLEVVWYLL
jgi:hypothetical protein